MAGRFMKIKKLVIPFMTLAIMTSQLAGCATVSSDETSKRMNESPDVSIESAVPDAGQQIMSDSDSEIELLNTGKQELDELGHDELIAVFENAYEASKEVYNSDSEETIQNELLMIEITAASDNKSLPSDYEAQYREWRPSVTQQTQAAPEDTLTKPESQPGSKPSGGSSGGQQTQGGAIIVEDDTTGYNLVNGSDLNKQMITDSKELDSGIADPYDGYGEVIIGFGEDIGDSGSGTIKYTPGGIKVIED